MDKEYYVIRDLLGGGFWDDYEERFRGVNYAYKIDVGEEPTINVEFQKARSKAQVGIELVKVYNT